MARAVRPLLLTLLAATPAFADADAAICTIKNPQAGQYKTATAVVPKSTPNAQEAANKEARAKLIARLCAESDCSSLEPSVYDWKAGSSADSICAGAAIEEKDYLAWKDRRARAESDFRQALLAALRPAAERLKTAAKKGPPLVLLGDVRDDDSVGGARSRWARLALQDALASLDLALLAAAGKRPAGSAELTADLVTLDGTRSELAASFELGGRLVTTPRLGFPNDIAPRAWRSARTVERDPRLRLHLDTRGGDLCDGQSTQLWLESDRPRCVVVVDTWAEDAILLFPNARHPSCLVKANVRVPAGGDKPFRVVSLPGVAEERYVALAADRLEQLPPSLRAMVKGLPATESCRLSDAQKRDLHAELPPSTARSELTFRLLQSSDACAGVPRMEREEYEAYLTSLGELVACP